MAQESITQDAKEPRIMDSAEIAIAKRGALLSKVKELGDPFTGRFLCDFQTIAHFAKKIIETDGRMSRPWIKNGISGSKILGNPLPWREDFSIIQPIRETLKEKVERYRIGESMWEFTYSFESFDEMIKNVLEVLVEYKEMKQLNHKEQEA